MSLKYLTHREYNKLVSELEKARMYIAQLTTQGWAMCKCGHTLEEHDDSGCYICDQSECRTFQIDVPETK